MFGIYFSNARIYLFFLKKVILAFFKNFTELTLGFDIF